MLHLAGTPSGPVREVAGLTVIPARASFRHARELARERAAEWDEHPQLIEAAMLHLDDPHYDAMLGLRDGPAVGFAGVLAVGDVGRIDQVFVSEKFRRRGIGRTMMSRAMEVSPLAVQARLARGRAGECRRLFPLREPGFSEDRADGCLPA